VALFFAPPAWSSWNLPNASLSGSLCMLVCTQGAGLLKVGEGSATNTDAATVAPRSHGT
jgi:hypothetical protein